MCMYRLVPSTVEKSGVKLAHACVQATVCILGLTGLWAAVEYHNGKASPHFYTLHSWFGLIAIIGFVLQVPKLQHFYTPPPLL